jgi:hypothetical protein
MAGPRTPGEQRPAGSPSTTLVRRPSERYADASAPTAGQPDSERQDPLPRAVGLTFIAGVVIAVLGNFGIVTGLIVAAATAAWLIATVVRGADRRPAAASSRSALPCSRSSSVRSACG